MTADAESVGKPTPDDAEPLEHWGTLLEAWEGVLADVDLAVATRKAWGIGRWLTITSDNRAIFEVPNEWVRKACLERLEEVEARLWVHWPRGYEPKIEVVVEEEPDDFAFDLDIEPFVKAALGNAISAARTKVGLSQRELGRRIGVDQSMISVWERGAGPGAPSVDRVLRLDLALGLQPGTLLVRSGLVRPDAIETAVRRLQGQGPADVTGLTIVSKTSTRTMNLQPKLTVDQWLELARTMIGLDETAADVTRVALSGTSPNSVDEVSIDLPTGGLDLEELLRLIEIMLEAQGEYEPPEPYDPSEEPF